MEWGLRLLLVVVGLGVLGMLALVLLVVVRPVVTEAVRANAAGDWWLPFLPDARGEWGPLVRNHWWALARAEEPGSAGGLAARWGFWSLMSVLLVVGAVGVVVRVARLLSVGWQALG
ncbi:hypothetical protein [uncultured Phycicoccus sp.]|uniref:hypothetical protein n=1 Tax=uncultured Phycicoccus sp. TaxID=661422 RepID=UPI0026067BC9|nr:hypothetical protein [uncultured Phycicoccus sp.]